jgi:hypothetical protein
VVTDSNPVRLQFVPSGGAQREEDLLRRLHADVKELRLGPVDFARGGAEPDGKLGLGPVEWVTVILTAGRGLRELLRLAVDWSRRARQPVRVRIGGDELLLHDATDDQQDRIVDAFLARHGAD